MPYVEIWVDEECCSGECETGERLREAAETALGMLRDGDQLGAIRELGAAVNDKQWNAEAEKEKELINLYFDWLSQEKPRPEFLVFAHSRRKLTAA